MLRLGGFSLGYCERVYEEIQKASSKSISLFADNAYTATAVAFASTQQVDLTASVVHSEYAVVKSGRVRVNMRASVIGSQRMAVDWRSQERLTASGLWVYKKPLWSFK